MIGLTRAIFLDRDGVINAMWLDAEHGTADSPAHPDQFHLLPGVGEAIQILRDLGFLIVVVSNQPGIAKGKMVPHLLEAITDKMHDELAKAGTKTDAIYYCLHHPEALVDLYRVICDCRKPKPGLLLKAAVDLNLDLSHSFMIGDGTNDVQAGKAAGCITVWVGSGQCGQCQALQQKNARPDYMAKDLLAAARLIQGVSP
jgi:D-glycero-D-manno-heptose 1,7-bisphosphate phosphatase